MKNPTFLLDQGETMGGAERFLVDFCNALGVADRRRLKPHIVGAKTADYKDLLSSEIPIIPFKYPNLKGSVVKRPFIAMGLLKAAWNLSRMIEKQQVQTIYTNTPKTHLIVWVMCLFFESDHLKWHAMIHDFTTPKWLLKAMGKYCKTIAVNSIGTREDTRKKIKPEHYGKIRIIENGVSIEDLPSITPSQGIKNILVMSRIDRRKGQNYALEAAKILQDKYPNIHFNIVGAPFAEDPETGKFYKELQDYAQSNNLKNVTFVGEVQDSFSAYKEADLVLFTPIDPEPFGRITIESLAMGKVVLAFNETGPREVIQQFSAFCRKKEPEIDLQVTERLLVNSCDADDLAKSIEYFIIQSDHMKAIAQHGRSFITEQYPLKETQKRLLQMLEEG